MIPVAIRSRLGDRLGNGVGSDMSEDRPCGNECDGERHECTSCGGAGGVLDDCFEDSCCCADPETQHGVVACENCSGAGGWPCPKLRAELNG